MVSNSRRVASYRISILPLNLDLCSRDDLFDYQVSGCIGFKSYDHRKRLTVGRSTCHVDCFYSIGNLSSN